jgi:hypothetical protein
MAVPPRAMAQDYIPATEAFEAPACSNVDLGGLEVDLAGFGIQHVPSPLRGNPEWKVITLDPSKATNLQPPTILEGFVSPQPNDQTSSSQSTSEVAEEDLWWTHYTHDFTFKVIPDPAYQHLLSSWVRFPGVTGPASTAIPDQNGCPAGENFDPTLNLCIGCPNGGTFLQDQGICQLVPPEVCPDGASGPTCQHSDMEVEWDSASLMDEKEGSQRDFGAVPEFVWPAVGDRVWVDGRWIFDCGHPGTPDADANNAQYVKFGTEMHPPRALVTFRLNHPALDSFPVARTSAPNFPAPQSYLPVTGCPVGSLCGPATLPPGVPNSGPTNVPVTEADIFVSVNGGAANDLCSITANPCAGHTGPILPVNDRNYVFDIYPPGTDYLGFSSPRVNGTFGTGPPVPDASLQWRVEDHSSELPAHACGGTDNTVCVTVDPIICLLDSSTPPPDQTETRCPAVPAHPTRLRVILPFAGTNANFFAKSILVGWDDVPTPANSTLGVRTFQVRLHNLTVKDNGAGCCNDGDWRVFVNVGGQYRYISPLFDAKSDGTSVCNGADPLTDNGNDDCYRFDATPWTVSVEDTIPIHVAVGGFVARGLEDSSSNVVLCRNLPPTPGATFPGGCDTPTDFDPTDKPFLDLGFDNDDRIGTYEFDLVAPDYAPPALFTTAQFGCAVFSLTGCSLRYQVEFKVQEIPAATPPASASLGIGTPNFGQFVTSSTPFTLGSTAPGAQGFQYRSYLQGGTLPTYPSVPVQPFPVHWTHADLPAGKHSVPVFLTGADGPYFLQYSAESFGQLLEPRHTESLILDNTPPVIGFVQPQATTYAHSAVLTLGYSVTDGPGSGVASFAPTMDGLTTLFGHGLASGQAINLLTELKLGPHTFRITAADNLNNNDASSVTFTIIVTPESIKGDVTQFLAAGKIKNQGIALALLGPLNAAAKARASGSCAKEKNVYQPLYRAFINELKALSGKGVDPTAAQIMIADAQYLIANCP